MKKNMNKYNNQKTKHNKKKKKFKIAMIIKNIMNKIRILNKTKRIDFMI